jgi:hypothetical protein
VAAPGEKKLVGRERESGPSEFYFFLFIFPFLFPFLFPIEFIFESEFEFSISNKMHNQNPTWCNIHFIYTYIYPFIYYST